MRKAARSLPPFQVDANDVINSKTKKQTISRVFFLKNNGQKSIPLKIEISPGSIFNVTKVETIDEFHEKYDPDVNQLKVETGQFLKVRNRKESARQERAP